MTTKGIIGMVPGLRTPHGAAAEGGAVIVSETLPPDEVARLAVHAEEHAEARGERRPDGRWVAGTRTAQSKGGKARKDSLTWARSMGLENLSSDPRFKAELRKSKAWVRDQRKAYATTYGGGQCGVAPSTLIVGAAWMFAAARALLAGDLDPKTVLAAANLQDKARTALLTASQLCATEAQARPKRGGLAALAARMGGKEPDR
ncbi:MAG: hypothetical protein JNL21_27625 [Myxococcales bacterium]|nr:hypothetical protein [Myxococcales bacterium]